jgi:hypothetical protein
MPLRELTTLRLSQSNMASERQKVATNLVAALNATGFHILWPSVSRVISVESPMSEHASQVFSRSIDQTKDAL